MDYFSTIITPQVFKNISLIWILVALIMLPLLLKVTQPYGRHTKKSWGPMINNKLAWFLMEVPSLLLVSLFVLSSGQLSNALVIAGGGLWIVHYFHRVFIYPLRIKTRDKKMPVVIMLFGIFFNLINGFLNGYWLANYAPLQESSMALNIRIVLGVLVFAIGFGINKYHDYLLIKLRNSVGKGYKIPYGGLFKYVSCPNFLGEIITWLGFFILAFNLPALSFFLWAIVNLLPRALDHHKWYKKEFADYPKKRKALIPGLI